jgi:hypothetical protein
VDLVARVEAALDRVESDPAALEAVQAVVELYGEGIRRIMAGAREEDELVSHLLVLHDLHPLPLEERVRAAVGDRAIVVSAHEGVVRIRLKGGCGSTGVEEVIRAAAPDVEAVLVADAVEPQVLRLPQADPA